MGNEPIRFFCSYCKKTSNGEIGFSYKEQVFSKREWFMIYEIETSAGTAKCEHCGMRNDVWPTMSIDVVWKKRDGKKK